MECGNGWARVRRWIATGLLILLVWPLAVSGEGYEGDVNDMAVAAFSSGGGGGTTTKKATKKKDEEKSFLDRLFGGSSSSKSSSSKSTPKTTSSKKSTSSKSKSSSKSTSKKSTSKKSTSKKSTSSKSSSNKTVTKTSSAPASKSTAPADSKPSAPAKKSTSITDQLTPAQAEALAAQDQAAANAARARRNTFSPEYLAAKEAAKQKPDYLSALQQGNRIGNLAATLNPGFYLPALAVGTGMALKSQQPQALNPNPIPVSTEAPNPITGEMQTIYTYDPVTGEPTAHGFASPDYQLLSGYRMENGIPNFGIPNYALPPYSSPAEAPTTNPYQLTIPYSFPDETPTTEEARRAEAASNYKLTLMEPYRPFEPLYDYPDLQPGEEVVYENPYTGSRMVRYTPSIDPSQIPEPWTPPSATERSGPPAAQPVDQTSPTMPTTPVEPPPVDEWTPPPGMTLEDALAMAEALYGPQYAELLRQRLQSQSIDLLQRGFYGQLPGYNLLMDVQARTAAEQATAERSYAEQLLQSDQAAQQEYERMKAEWELQNQQMDQTSKQNRQKSLQDSVNAIVNLIDTVNKVRSSFDTSSTGTGTPGAAETFAATPAVASAGSKQASKQSVGLRQPISLNQPLQTYPQDLYTPPNVATRPISLGVG